MPSYVPKAGGGVKLSACADRCGHPLVTTTDCAATRSCGYPHLRPAGRSARSLRLPFRPSGFLEVAGQIIHEVCDDHVGHVWANLQKRRVHILDALSEIFGGKFCGWNRRQSRLKISGRPIQNGIGVPAVVPLLCFEVSPTRVGKRVRRTLCLPSSGCCQSCGHEKQAPHLRSSSSRSKQVCVELPLTSLGGRNQ